MSEKRNMNLRKTLMNPDEYETTIKKKHKYLIYKYVFQHGLKKTWMFNLQNTDEYKWIQNADEYRWIRNTDEKTNIYYIIMFLNTGDKRNTNLNNTVLRNSE